MRKRLTLWLIRLRGRLWVRPLAYCLGAVIAALLAQAADGLGWAGPVPEVTRETVLALLGVISSTMLAVATFALGSMVSAYALASRSATPRAFQLVLADDTSQAALSRFVGAFIFSIVGIVALRTGLYGPLGRLALFVLTLLILAWVILTFLAWVDQIARLGQMNNTIDRVEAAARACLIARRDDPAMGGVLRLPGEAAAGEAVAGADYGYVQRVDMAALQAAAEAGDGRIYLEAQPGAFVAPGKALAIVVGGEVGAEAIRAAFVIGAERTFETDPRFGLIVLAEIAGRALSPGVNDPGTAIAILGRFVRLFAAWAETADAPKVRFDRVVVPDLALASLFDDAFTSTARDGAGTVEVGVRLQKALISLAHLPGSEFPREAARHSALALDRARAALTLPEDVARVEALAKAVAEVPTSA